MRSPLAPILTIALAAALLACGWLFLRERETRASFREMRDAEQASRESYNRTIESIAEIQDSLDALAPAESLLAVKPGSLVTEEQLAGPDGRRALERIAALRAGLARNRDRIQRLESELAKAGDRAEGLRRVISGLRRDLAEKQASLEETLGQVASLRGLVTGLEAEVQQGRDSLVARDAALDERRRELATVFYVVGTRSQLVRQGAVVIRGGLLGLGGTPVPSGRVTDEALSPLDTDAAGVLPTHAAKARVLTAQPVGSYEFRPGEGGLELHILDPAQFRKVRQLIVITG